ncbi:hypothetical protein SH1V18_14920 [Vallitalea longa]|uniref:Uncharacterized protein n=1 Tax=Vallitalea longa TaxID=2936439 RepID=A0A9W6DF14_9FIRM|nr:hypothetical protein [Vallitalea longa]GKX29012.1 hypothetical protein SH1V18_14920 [Vallitalea longa]
MRDTIKNALNDIATTQWMIRPSGFPSISFRIINEEGSVFTTGGEVETELFIQVDIWTKKQIDHVNISKSVKERLMSLDFSRPFETEEYESDTNIFHYIQRYYYLRNNESEVIQ